MEQIKPVIMDKVRFEYRDLSNLGAIWISRVIKIPRQRKKISFLKKIVIRQKHKAFGWDLPTRNEVSEEVDVWLGTKKIVENKSFSLGFSNYYEPNDET